MCTIIPVTIRQVEALAGPTGMADYIAPQEKIKGLGGMVLKGR